MIDGKYFELNHGNRETAPDGLINNLDLLNDIHTFIDLLKAMEPYKSRKPAFTAAKIVELVMNVKSMKHRITIQCLLSSSC